MWPCGVAVLGSRERTYFWGEAVDFADRHKFEQHLQRRWRILRQAKAPDLERLMRRMAWTSSCNLYKIVVFRSLLSNWAPAYCEWMDVLRMGIFYCLVSEHCLL